MQKGRYNVRFMVRDIFRFAEHQEKPTFRSGYKLTLTRSTDNSVLYKDISTNIGKKVINNEWYIAHYTPSIPQRAIISKQISSKLPTELQFVERSVFL